jgi:hypothetical protein
VRATTVGTAGAGLTSLIDGRARGEGLGLAHVMSVAAQFSQVNAEGVGVARSQWWDM